MQVFLNSRLIYRGSYMNYDKVINDIEKLVGLRLNSIKPGAEIKILEVDRKKIVY